MPLGAPPGGRQLVELAPHSFFNGGYTFGSAPAISSWDLVSLALDKSPEVYDGFCVFEKMTPYACLRVKVEVLCALSAPCAPPPICDQDLVCEKELAIQVPCEPDVRRLQPGEKGEIINFDTTHSRECAERTHDASGDTAVASVTDRYPSMATASRCSPTCSAGQPQAPWAWAGDAPFRSGTNHPSFIAPACETWRMESAIRRNSLVEEIGVRPNWFEPARCRLFTPRPWV